MVPMVVLLSPAKTMDMAVVEGEFLRSETRMQAQTAALLLEMQKKDRASLRKMMGVSESIAALNHDRFQSFDEQGEKQAALAFDGPAYKANGLRAHQFTPRQQAFANAHLRILCGLYGVLRPFDKIRPYRLEMGNSLKVGETSNLYQFWGSQITEQIVADMGPGAQSGLLINCASQEYFKSVRTAELPPGCRVVTCDFPGSSVFAKRARGLMSRFIIEFEVEDAEQLKAFRGYDEDVYVFSKAQSTDDKFVFLRQAGKASVEAGQAGEGSKEKGKKQAGKHKVEKADVGNELAAEDSLKPLPVAGKAKRSAVVDPSTGSAAKRPKRDAKKK